MSYQKAIAEKIIDKGSDYLFGLKDNQNDVRLHFEQLTHVVDPDAPHRTH